MTNTSWFYFVVYNLLLTGSVALYEFKQYTFSIVWAISSLAVFFIFIFEVLEVYREEVLNS